MAELFKLNKVIAGSGGAAVFHCRPSRSKSLATRLRRWLTIAYGAAERPDTALLARRARRNVLREVESEGAELLLASLEYLNLSLEHLTLRGGVAVTIDHLLTGVGILLILIFSIFLIKLRAVNLRLRVLQAQIEDMRILTSRLLLKELNARDVGNVSEKPAHKGEPTSDNQSTRRPPEPV
jgi:hypothetical protein